MLQKHTGKGVIYSIILAVLIIAYTASFTIFQILEHYTYHTHALDLGTFMQSLYSLCRYGKPLVNNAEGPWVFNMPIPVSHFSVHNMPILFLIAPIYCIAPTPITLFVFQSLVLSLAAIPIFSIARRHLRNEFLSLIIVLLYLANPGLHGMNSFEFHPEVLAIPVLLWLIDTLERENIKLAISLSALALMIKEDIAIGLICIGMWFLYKRIFKDFKISIRNITRIVHTLCRDKICLFSLLLIVISEIWLFISIFIIIPHFSPIGRYPMIGWYYSKHSALSNVGIKFEYTLTFLASLGFLPLWSIDAFILLCMLPWLEVWLSGNLCMSMYGYHYVYLILPMSIVCSIYGLRALRISGLSSRKILCFIIPIAAFSILFTNPVPPSLGTSLNIVSYRPLYLPTYHDILLTKVVNILRENINSIGVGVCTSDKIFPHLANSLTTYLGFWGSDKCKYVLLDSKFPSYFYGLNILKRLVENGTYHIYYAIDGIYLLVKGSRIKEGTINVKHYLLLYLYNSSSRKSTLLYTLQIVDLRIHRGLFIYLPNNFSFVIKGKILIRRSGYYTLILILNPHCKLMFHIGNRTYSVNRTRSLKLYLASGLVSLNIYCECRGDIRYLILSILWITPRNVYPKPIPYTVLYPES